MLDADLHSIQEARDLVRRSASALETWRRAEQAQVDRVCEAVVEAGRRSAERLGALACEESGFGDPNSKTRKNLFSTVDLWESIRDLKTVGCIRRDDEKRLYEIAEPFGV